MYYSAMVNGDGKTAFGQNMPLVNVSSGNVSVRALEQAGWKHHPDDFGGYYSLTKVDGTYYADESRYETIRDSFRRIGSKSFCVPPVRISCWAHGPAAGTCPLL